MESFFAAFINVLLYLVLFIVCWRKNKKIGVAEWLILAYVVVAAFCFNTYITDARKWQLSVFRFAYLFTIVSLFILPLSDDAKIDIKYNPISDRKYGWYKLLCYFYIFLSLYSCVVYFPQFQAALTRSDWLDLYEASHEVKASNFFTKIANLFFHLRFLGVVLFFSFLAKRKESKPFMLLLGIAAFAPLVIVTVANASRGGIISIALSVFLSYYLFKSILPRGTKRAISFLFLLFIPVAAIYLWSVTVSRFENGYFYDSVNDSMFYYIGHSMLCFNYGVMDSINGLGMGGYMFDTPGVKNITGTHFGTEFMTFVGCLYLDFGLILTFVIAFIIYRVMKAFVKIGRKGIPEYFIILTYIMFVFNGVFVLPRGYGMQWVEAIIIYFLLRFGEKGSKQRIEHIKY